MKLTQRATVYELYRSLRNPKLPLAYVDDDEGSATSFFLKRGATTSNLMPINYSASACASILASTGVEATCIDACRTSVPRKCGVVWLDVQSKRIDDEALASLQCEFLIVTLSTRGERPDAIVGEASSRVRRHGFEICETSRYKGRSNITNVVKIICQRRHAPPPTTTPLVGTNVYIPVRELRNGYKGITKVKNGNYVFRVTKTFYRKRFVVQRLLPNNKLSPEKEPWVLTPSEVRRYLGDQGHQDGMKG